MKVKRLYSAIIIAVILVVFSLVFTVLGIMTPSEKFDELSGFGKIFAASPEFGFESGSFVTSFGGYSLSINFGFDKPAFDFLSDSNVVHLNFLIVVLGVLLLVFSCVIPEISLGTSLVVSAVVGTALVRLALLLKQQVASGVSSWDAAAGAFWFVSFLLMLLSLNGLIGICGKIVKMVLIIGFAKVAVALLVSLVLANAISLFIGLFAYVTVGLGWCGGVMLWFIVTLLFVLFCEIMNIISF